MAKIPTRECPTEMKTVVNSVMSLSDGSSEMLENHRNEFEKRTEAWDAETKYGAFEDNS